MTERFSEVASSVAPGSSAPTSEATGTTPKSDTERMRFDEVTAVVGGQTLLSGVDFAVEPGEVVGLVGRNGVGKTTLLRIASAALDPGRGEVRFREQPVLSMTRRALARSVALVPQDMHVSFPFRVGELVLMGRAPHQPLLGLESDADEALAMAALDRMGIAALADRSVATLSGGERQLALFARALVQDPELLLLDEPTAFLDLKHRIELLQEVRRFAAAGGSALIVSHDLTLAAQACDRVVLLGAGGVVAVGPPATVFSSANLQVAFETRVNAFEAPDGSLVVVPQLTETAADEG